MRFRNRAKLFAFMVLAKLSFPARALAALCIAAVAAACGNSGPGPEPTEVTVTAVSPNSGTTFGGTTVTITGSGFQSGATVQIGGSAATDITVTNSTTLTAKTPVHAAGASEVRVTVGSKTGTLAGAFTFVKPAATGPNTVPVVSSLTVQPPRPDQPLSLASIGDRISLTAAVNDAETPASQLTYEWTAVPNVGTFAGTGAAVQWTAPASTTSPQSVTLTLTVVEKYQEPDAQGLPINREHRVQRAVLIKVHDTVKEVTDMATDFLTLFSNSNLGPEAVLHNFSRTCDDGDGYREEYQDVVESRATRVILSHTFTGPTVFEYEFGADNACSRRNSTPGDVCVEVPIRWTDRLIGSSTVNTVQGVDFVTGVYENSQWRLCHSRWTPTTSTGTLIPTLDFSERLRLIKRFKDK